MADTLGPKDPGPNNRTKKLAHVGVHLDPMLSENHAPGISDPGPPPSPLKIMINNVLCPVVLNFFSLPLDLLLSVDKFKLLKSKIGAKMRELWWTKCEFCLSGYHDFALFSVYFGTIRISSIKISH